MISLSPTIKGLITGILMIATSLATYAYLGNFESQLQYITYALYIGGIAWTLIAYSKMEVLKTFKTYFSQGFKCFIVVTLLMVAFTFGFLQMNPGMKEEMAQNYRAELVKKGDKTPPEIDSLVIQAKEYFITTLTSAAIFSYLFIGSIVTILITLVLLVTQRKHAHHRTINT